MVTKLLNIMEFITHAELLNDQTLSISQQTFLKATYGLPLTSEERDVFERATGRSENISIEQNEATLIVGRRGGKTSKVAARIALYEACRQHSLGRGERGYVMLIAPTKRQASIAMRYIRGDIRSSKLLRRNVIHDRRDEIALANGVSIVCYPCSHIAVRGVSVVCCICDELAFWRHDDNAASPEEEVLAAVRPAMATISTGKLIKISTPYRKEGVLWREFQQRNELDHLVWHFPSWEMNPTLGSSFLDRERQRDEEKFRREYAAEFTDQVAAWISSDMLDLCIVRGRTELPHVGGDHYVMAIDPAFRHSDFALAVLHRAASGAIVIDRLKHWTGTKANPLPFEWVCEQIVETARQYGIGKIVGDQYCSPIIKQQFDKLGIHYVDHTFGARTRAELFGNLRHLLTQRKIELLDHPMLLRQLRALEECATPNGNVDIRPSRGQKDDIAVAMALAAFEISKKPTPREPMVEVIFVPRTQNNRIDSSERGWFNIGQG